VEHFPYRQGLLVSYWNTAVSNNNTRTHPGTGRILPVDARPAALKWSDGTVARNRIQTYDATFGPGPTHPLDLHREVAGADGAVTMTTLETKPSPHVSVFDDTNPNAYYDTANPMGSVRVAGTGTKIKVVKSGPDGFMTVKVN